QLQEILGGWGFLYTSLPKDTIEGIRVAGPSYVFERTKQAEDFERRFSERYGRPPNFDAAFAYEVVRTLPELVRGMSADANIKKRATELGAREGVVGKYSFTSDGNMIVSTGMGVYRDGVIVPAKD